MITKASKRIVKPSLRLLARELERMEEEGVDVMGETGMSGC